MCIKYDLATDILFGRHNNVKMRLVENAKLAYASMDGHDHVGTFYSEFTGFQMSVACYDYHMWNMIKASMDPNLISEQLSIFFTAKGKDALHKSQTSMQALLNAMGDYELEYNNATVKELCKMWLKIGGLQKKLPANILKEYLNPNRTFYPILKHTDIEREVMTNVIDIDSLDVDALGESHGLLKHIHSNVVKKDFVTLKEINADRLSLSAIIDTRINQCKGLFSEYCQHLINKENTALFAPSSNSGALIKRTEILLQHVVNGKYNEVKNLIMMDKTILEHKSNVKNYYGKLFKNVTAFQLAVILMDSNMWQFMENHLSKEKIIEQLKDLELLHKGMLHDTEQDMKNLFQCMEFCENDYDYNISSSANRWSIIGQAQKKIPIHFLYKIYVSNVYYPGENFAKRLHLEKLGNYFALLKVREHAVIDGELVKADRLKCMKMFSSLTIEKQMLFNRYLTPNQAPSSRLCH
jgi:hypothetical protein